jgi:hypothetical protein
MNDDPSPADAARAMNTTLLRQQRRAGRFGRTVPAPDERFETLGYAVDPDAVAGAIVERLLAGRTWRLPRRDECHLDPALGARGDIRRD